jgi:hypothetical protein
MTPAARKVLWEITGRSNAVPLERMRRGGDTVHEALMDGTLLGWDQILDSIEALAGSGETLLIFGPLGIGKTAILGELDAGRGDR